MWNGPNRSGSSVARPRFLRREEKQGKVSLGGRSSPPGGKQQLGAGRVRGAEGTGSDRYGGHRCPMIANCRLLSEHDRVSSSAFNSEA